MVAVKLESAAGTTTQKRASRAANEDDTLLATTVTAFLLDAGIKDAKGAVNEGLLKPPAAKIIMAHEQVGRAQIPGSVHAVGKPSSVQCCWQAGQSTLL
jgi:hypothetical protein